MIVGLIEAPSQLKKRGLSSFFELRDSQIAECLY